jgi:iron-sulfur cluster assembly protein
MSTTTAQPVQTTPVQLTDDAVQQLLQIRLQEGVPEDYCLRVGVEGGGCSGFTYILRFDKPQPADDIFEIKGIRVAMNKAHAIYLLGMEIDFLNGLANRGFTFNNPNASSTCGCGTSFSA